MGERDGLAERERQDREKAEANKARQIRQGHVSEESAKAQVEEVSQTEAPTAKSE